MNLMDLINTFRQQRQPQQQAAPTPGGAFLPGLLDGSYSGAPPGFSMPFPSVMGMEGNKYYPEFRFGYSGNPALERLGVTQPGGLPPGMAMQLAQSQYFAPGSGQGVNMAGRGAPPAAPAANPLPGGQKIGWVPGMGGYFSGQLTTKEGQSPFQAYAEYQQNRSQR